MKGMRSCAFVFARTFTRDRLGRFARVPGIDADQYHADYGNAVFEHEVADTDLTVRVFEDGTAHIVAEYEDDGAPMFDVLFDWGSSADMRKSAAGLEWASQFSVPDSGEGGIVATRGIGDGWVVGVDDEGLVSVIEDRSPGPEFESGVARARMDQDAAADLAAGIFDMAEEVDGIHAAADDADDDEDEGDDDDEPQMKSKGAELRAWIRSAQERNVELAAKVREQMAAEGRAPQSWFRIDNAAGADRADVYLYGEIGCWGVTASDFARELTGLTAKTITLHVNSPGGEVFDGVAIYTTLKNHAARIDVLVEGLAASAASFIVQAGDSVVMSRGATMMIHDASTMTWGNPGDHRRTADLLDQLSETIADIYVGRAGHDTAHWRELMRAETWMTAAEAVAHGLADKVADDKPAAPAEPSASWDLTVYRYAGRTAAPTPPAPRDDYDPGQRRDDHGRWSDGMPDVISTEALGLLGGSVTVSAHRDQPGAVRISDGTHTAVVPEPDVARLAFATSGELRAMKTGTTEYVGPWFPAEGEQDIHLAVTRTAEDRWELKVADPTDTPESLAERPGIAIDRRKDLKALLEAGQRQSASRRVTTDGGPVDIYPAGPERMGLRVRQPGDGGEVKDMSFSAKEWRQVRDALDVVWEGSDEHGEVSEVTVQTGVGPLSVARFDDSLSIAPATSDAWHITWPMVTDHPIWDAFDDVETANGIYNRGERLFLAQSRSLLSAPAVTDSDWAVLTAALTNPAPSTSDDALVALREAL